MAIAFAVTNGPSPLGGFGLMAIGAITWDASSLVTGEPIPELVNYFSTIQAIIPSGVSALGLAGYVPSFVFDATAAVTAANVLAVLGRIPLLEIDDTVDIAAQPLVPADALDVAAIGTTQITVIGMPLA